MDLPPATQSAKQDDLETDKRWLVDTYLPSLLPAIKAAITEAQEILAFPAHSVKLVSLKSTEYADFCDA